VYVQGPGGMNNGRKVTSTFLNLEGTWRELGENPEHY